MASSEQAYQRDKHLFGNDIWVLYVNGQLTKVTTTLAELPATSQSDDNYVTFTGPANRTPDNNHLAYERDKHMFKPCEWVLYVDGELVATDMDPGKLMHFITGTCLLHQHGVEECIAEIG
jgi:hypothetical protein